MEPVELVGMDLVGKQTVTNGGNRYICVKIDYFTKWAEACPLKSKTAAEVTSCILDCFNKFVAPKTLLTNQGSEFANDVNYRFLSFFGNQKVDLVVLSCPSFRRFMVCAKSWIFKEDYAHCITHKQMGLLNGTIQRPLSKPIFNKSWKCCALLDTKVWLNEFLCLKVLEQACCWPPHKWDEVLQPTIFTLRTKCHITKYAPHFLMLSDCGSLVE